MVFKLKFDFNDLDTNQWKSAYFLIYLDKILIECLQISSQVNFFVKFTVKENNFSEIIANFKYSSVE